MLFENILQSIVHYGLHIFLPWVVSIIFFKPVWKKAFIIMLLTMLIDIDHVLANPVFDPFRCSIGIHPLHSFIAIGVYFILLWFKKTRILATGLLLHMFVDFTDCIWMWNECENCITINQHLKYLFRFFC